MRTLFGVLLAGAMAPCAFAQSPASPGSDLPDRFQIDTGYFRIASNTVLRLNSPNGGLGTAIDFEKDLGVPADVDTFWLDATWRVGRRHQLKLGYTRVSRERESQTLGRDFEWGGETYNAGLSVDSATGADILGGYYRFAAFRNDRFEIGPTIGIGNLWLDASISATASVTGPGGSAPSRTVERAASTSSITGAVGAYANAWPTKRLALKADFLYIKVEPEDSEASVTDWRLGADYYFFRHAGLGVQYKYNNYSYDRGILATKLGGEITYEGFQLFASFLF
jgi:predicted porin